MSFLQLTHGRTGRGIIPVYLVDANGDGVGGIAAATVSARYKRQGGVSQPISVVDATTEGVWQAGGWHAAANMTAGNYELHLPDAALASGTNVEWVEVEVQATGTRAERYLIQIGPYDVLLPDNFGDLAITPTTGMVTVGTNGDKGGYALDPDQSAVTLGSVLDVVNRVSADVTRVNNNATAAANLARGALGVVIGSAVTGTLSTTQMSTNLTETTNDHYVGRTVLWTSGALTGQASTISAYNGTSKVLTFSNTTDAPVSGDQFVIV